MELRSHHKGTIIFFLSLDFLKLRLPKFINKESFYAKSNSNYKAQKKEPIINKVALNFESKVEQYENIDNNHTKSNYISPSLDILESKNINQKISNKEFIERNSNLLVSVFADFNI